MKNASWMWCTRDVKVTKHWNFVFSSSNEEDSLPCKNGGHVRISREIGRIWNLLTKALPKYCQGTGLGEAIDVEGTTSEWLTVEVGILASGGKTGREWCFIFNAKFLLRVL